MIVYDTDRGPDYTADRDAAIRWARGILAANTAMILDTETTGLDGQAQVIQVGVLSLRGKVLLDALVTPTTTISAGAAAIHGLSADDVAGAALFEEIHAALARITHERPVIIFNAAFDTRLLRQTCAAHGCPELELRADCAMEQYSQYIGEWNEDHGNYRWQRLPGGDHTAIGDCRSTLTVIEQMAATPLSTERAS